jgi:hypothetical protein
VGNLIKDFYEDVEKVRRGRESSDTIMQRGRGTIGIIGAKNLLMIFETWTI